MTDIRPVAFLESLTDDYTVDCPDKLFVNPGLNGFLAGYGFGILRIAARKSKNPVQSVACIDSDQCTFLRGEAIIAFTMTMIEF